jgi:hypothetical protein
VGSTSNANPNQGMREPGTESLPAGGVAGIILSSAFVVFGIVYITNKKRKRDEKDPDLRDVRNKDLDDLETGVEREMNDEGRTGARENVRNGKDDVGCEVGQASIQNQVSNNVVEEEEEIFIGNIVEDTLKLSDIAARPPPSLASTTLLAGVPTSPLRDHIHDDSSSAGESGWSSSAGLSSLNTSSFDHGTDDGLMPASPSRLYTTIGVTDAVTATGSTQRNTK